MKPWLHILLSCFLLAACAKHEAPPPEEDMLYRVECFYQQNPDSAIQILDTLDVLALTEDERAHYDLLLARTMAMLNMDQKMVDSLIDEAENHYAGGNDKYHEAMTYWHKAWKTSETNKLDYRQKALQTIGRCRHVDERLVLYSEEPTDEQTIIDRLKFAIHQRLGGCYGKQDNLKLVVCGSSTSWMTNKLIGNRSGLHNRVTRQIRLQPFNLHETEIFLQSKGFSLPRKQIVEAYMVMGGTPFYWT